ncbi:MAG: T9SS type A sorting domain-containing protein [Bacteroidetes bacterium]|nr:T9SS type A sorting domain-containing protein [Bacteroidota bacterium]MBK7639477.1 T9SS type A sorting domain-containing protein [Bacteroidota bacterium]MBK9633990.1 T9SS type A sorting domain-containing protein [Bacteroidota bacterium]MBL0078968.1 T9SS type A sorting domain-containing protein [Bacteroidota bacterium]MBL0287954.1 T9SS type A sorting domain-containing protein [Bacteroidota bacterium]
MGKYIVLLFAIFSINFVIDLNDKSAGTYFVTLSDNGFKQTLKLIVY